jgi:hypothetical protein
VIPRFYDARKRLTAYALACGYMERKTYGNCEITLWQEHGVYHVRAHVRAHDNERGRRFWASFRTLTEARRHYANAEALCVAHL